MGTRFSSPVQIGRWAHTASHTMGTGSFPGVKRPGRGVDHPSPSSTEVMERVELYLYSPFGLSWPVTGWILSLTLLLPPALTLIKPTFCPHDVSVCFVRMSEKTAIISLWSINWLVCIAEMKCVHCAVRKELLHFTEMNVSDMSLILIRNVKLR